MTIKKVLEFGILGLIAFVIGIMIGKFDRVEVSDTLTKQKVAFTGTPDYYSECEDKFLNLISPYVEETTISYFSWARYAKDTPLWRVKLESLDRKFIIERKNADMCVALEESWTVLKSYVDIENSKQYVDIQGNVSNTQTNGSFQTN